MYFKPRIFVSSSFKIMTIRSELEQFFTSVGAEIMLYENNLTPSINPATYRQDILESDFVIFILDDYYGTKTNTGKSGTHEEWDILVNTPIPKHVYVKKTTGKKEKEMIKFVNENIVKNYISYYYYEDEHNLLKKIRETTFTIARDVSIFKLDQQKISENSIRRLAINHDYEIALQFIRGMEDIQFYYNEGLLDITRTNILSGFIGLWEDKAKIQPIFVDNHMNILMKELIVNKRIFYSLHSNIGTTKRFQNVLLDRVNLTMSVAYLTMDGTPDQFTELDRLITRVMEAYREFKQYALKQKNNFDIYL